VVHLELSGKKIKRLNAAPAVWFSILLLQIQVLARILGAMSYDFFITKFMFFLLPDLIDTK